MIIIKQLKKKSYIDGKIKTITYKLKFIDSFRFIRTSLHYQVSLITYLKLIKKNVNMHEWKKN